MMPTKTSAGALAELLPSDQQHGTLSLSNPLSEGGSGTGLDPATLNCSTADVGAAGEWSPSVEREPASAGGLEFEAKLVPMPASVGAFVQRALGGPGAPSEAKAWLWVTALVSFFVAAGFVFAEGLPIIDHKLELGGRAVAAIACFLQAPSLVARVRLLRGALIRETSSLHGLLRDEVTSEVAAKIAAVLRSTAARGSVAVVVLSPLVALTAYIVNAERAGGLTTLEIAAFVLTAISAPAAITARAGCDFIAEVAFVVVVDRVRQLANRVRHSTPSTLNFEGMLAELAEAQGLVSAVSAELALPTVLQLAYLAALGLGFVFVGSGPQPSDGLCTWNTLWLAQLCNLLGATAILLAIRGLMQGAKITSACDALGDAINELRLGRTHGDTAVHMPTDPEKLAIEHLHSYVRRLNRGHGMGFVISKKRISHSFVLSLTLKVASAMPFCFAIVLKEGASQDDQVGSVGGS